MKIVVACIALLLLISCGTPSTPENITPVSPFDAQRYLGTWYEVARLKNRFERGMTHVTAEYALRDDGGIRVVNKGYLKDENKWNSVEGKAYFVQGENTGFLKVSFWGPFYSAYIVFELDDDYQYALVSGEDKSYFWLLARQPDIDPALYQTLINKAKSLGFDTSQLIKTDHSVNATQQVSHETP